MKRNHIMIFTACVALVLAAAGCKTMGMAGTSKGQLFKINIYAPESLPEGGEDNVDVTLSNRGVNNIQDILADVELPPQITVLDQTNDRGIGVVHDTGSNTYHFTIGKMQPAEDSHLRFRVRTNFGGRSEADVNVTAWQKDLPGEKLFRKTVIKLR
jgi:hypothetical protein